MNKKVKILILVITLILVLVGFFIINKKTYKIELKSKEFNYEFGEKISSNASSYLKNGEAIKNIKAYKLSSETLKIKNDNFIMKDSDVIPIGKYTITVSYKNKKEEFVIKVADTIAPEFISYKELIELEETSENVDLTSYFEATDLSDVTLSIEGEYDLSKAGEYNLKVLAKDKNSNVTFKKFVLKVIKKELNQDKESEQKSNANSNSTTSSKNESKVTENNPISSSPTYRKDISNNYVNQINIYRKEKGLTELSVTMEAQNEADRRAKELVNNYSHEGSGYGYGEIIGHGSVGVDFITAWKNSPTHNATILREQNTSIASSVYEVNNHWYAVIVFRMNY